MLHRSVINLCLSLLIISPVHAQTLNVDPIRGQDSGNGREEAPLRTLDQAMQLAGHFSGTQAIRIRLAPGLYILPGQLEIPAFPGYPDTALLSVEAMTLPDDPDWSPDKMPVIQSVSGNNKNYGHFPHCIGFQIERDHVRLAGLKFTGNANPGVEYYYPVERHDSSLTGLAISQCLFIGDRYATPIQGAIFVQGKALRVDHCIFYGCKNAVLTFAGVRDFALTHSIISGAYEAALWYGYGPSADQPFTFRDNIVANSNCFFAGYKGIHPGYTFQHSWITGNKWYLGFNGKSLTEDLTNRPRELDVRKSGTVRLAQITANEHPGDYLHPLTAPENAGIDAGIFTASRPGTDPFWKSRDAYLGQMPPGDTPQVFARALLNKADTFPMDRVAFSADGKEFYYLTNTTWFSSKNGKIRYYKYKGKKWTGPFVLNEQYASPTFSMDDQTMYFRGGGTKRDTLYDYVWQSRRTANGWTEPEVYLKKEYALYDFMPTYSGTCYVGSNARQGSRRDYSSWDFCELKMSDGDTIIRSLGAPLNTPGFDGDFYIARDESYMIISTKETKDFECELWISFRKPDHSWTDPISLGPLINDGVAHRWGQYVSPDGRYLFYSHGTSPKDCQIWWVRFDRLLEKLRKQALGQ